MRWSLHLGRIAGIDVKVHFTFFLLLAFYGFMFAGQGGLPAAVHGIIFISLVFLCVLLHEFGHAMAARRYGIHTPDITLLPIGGVARLERIPEKPSEEIVVALAGPLVNVAICAVLFPFIQDNFHPGVLERFEPGLLLKLFGANVMLVVFNLIPAFPMDGGRVFRALLAMRMDFAKATRIAATIGQALACAGGMFALLHGIPVLALVAVFIFLAAQNEAAHAQMRAASAGLRVRDAMILRFEALPRTATLHRAVEAVLHSAQRDFPVVDEAGALCGVLTRDDLVGALRKNAADTPVAEIMRLDVPVVHDAMFLDRAFTLMQEAETSALPVVDGSGRLCGLFTHENVGELMMIQTALRGGPRSPARPPPLPARV